MRTVVAIALGCAVTFACAGSNFAQAQPDPASARRAANAKSFVTSRGAGGTVKVKLLDGTKIKGRITRIGNTSFELVRKPGQLPVAYDYGAVAEIKKAGWSTAAMIVLGVGIGAAVVVAVVLIAVATVDLDPFPGGIRILR